MQEELNNFHIVSFAFTIVFLLNEDPTLNAKKMLELFSPHKELHGTITESSIDIRIYQGQCKIAKNAFVCD